MSVQVDGGHDGSCFVEDARGQTIQLSIRWVLSCTILVLAISIEAKSQTFDALIDRYEDLLLFEQSDYTEIEVTTETLRDSLMPDFRRAVRKVRDYPYDDPVRDLGGTPAALRTSYTVTNNTAAPTLTTNGAAVDGTALTLTYNEALDEGSVPATTAYEVTVAGNMRTVSAVDVSGSTVTLTLASAVTAGLAVSVTYSVPMTDPVRDRRGTSAAALASQTVTVATAAPELTTNGAAVDGTALTLTYNEALDEGSVPATTAYEVTVAGNMRTVSAVDVSGSTVTLTLASAVTAGLAVSVTYSVPMTGPVRDPGGTSAAALASQTVTNTTAAPELTANGAAVDGTALTLTYNEALDEGSVPATTAYEVTVAGNTRTVSAVDVSGSTVTLMLASAVTAGQAVSVTYSVPMTGPVRDRRGTSAAALASQTVTVATAAPELTANGAAVDGTALTLTYNESLDEESVPAATAYSVTVAGESRTVSTVDVSGSTVTLRLASAVVEEQVVLLTYSVPAMDPVRDPGGTSAAGLTNQRAINWTEAPALTGLAVDGTALTLTYNEALDEESVPESTAYAVTEAGESRTVSTVDVSGSTVTLRLASAVTAGQEVTVAYTVPVKQIALFVSRPRNAPQQTAAERALEELNQELHNLVNTQLPRLVIAYFTPGIDGEVENPYYKDPTLIDLYVRALEHSYLRGLTENAWLPDHAGNASADAIAEGYTRSSGDFSTVSLRLAGYIQSVFLMRDALKARSLLGKYKKVVRNLVVNNGTMYPAFVDHARGDAGIKYENPLPAEQKYHTNADGARIFVDNFWPYYLLTEEGTERNDMTTVLSGFIAKNIATVPGIQATIKPDGTGFHHGTAYVGAYSPFAIGAFAQLLYMAKGTSYYTSDNVDAVELGVVSFRQMVQKYESSAALRGRFTRAMGIGVSASITKAMLFLAHLEGVDDSEMTDRFKEFFDPAHFYAKDGDPSTYHEGGRGLQIRGLGIYRLVKELQDTTRSAIATPSGFWVKPFAAAAFYRKNNWLVTAKGFSQYFWDYEGPLDAKENSFGQNWAYGLLQVFNAGDPIGEVGSGYDPDNGWDWYHIPGTTASNYPIEFRFNARVRALRKDLGIRQRDTHRNYNTKKFVGGVSLGDVGLFVQDLEALPFIATTDLQARKSYYFVGGRVLALGTHISGGTSSHETHTTLFQTKLETASTPTWVDGTEINTLNGETRKDAGTRVSMTDSVGNSYFLAQSTDQLVISRARQSSRDEKYVPTSGNYAKAYLDHGIDPTEDSYQYVLIPNDSDRSELVALAADPGAYYEVLKNDSMHLVEFPAHNAVGYAFFEKVDTPAEVLVKSASLNAAVMTLRVGDTIRLGASVPDMGWEFDASEIETRGLSYTNKQFARQEAAEYTLDLVLRGNWCLSGSPDGARTVYRAGETTLYMECSQGLTSQVSLQACPTISEDFTGDGEFDGDDALALYYVKKLGAQIAHATSSASIQLRATLLTDLAGGSDRTDTALQAIVTSANEATAAVADTYLDVNQDSTVDADDFLILYYAHTLTFPGG